MGFRSPKARSFFMGFRSHMTRSFSVGSTAQMTRTILLGINVFLAHSRSTVSTSIHDSLTLIGFHPPHGSQQDHGFQDVDGSLFRNGLQNSTGSYHGVGYQSADNSHPPYGFQKQIDSAIGERASAILWVALSARVTVSRELAVHLRVSPASWLASRSVGFSLSIAHYYDLGLISSSVRFTA